MKRRHVFSYKCPVPAVGEVRWECQGRTEVTGRRYWYAVDEAQQVHAHYIALCEEDEGPVAAFETAESRREAREEAKGSIRILIEILNLNAPLLPWTLGIPEGKPFSHIIGEPQREIRRG